MFTFQVVAVSFRFMHYAYSSHFIEKINRQEISNDNENFSAVPGQVTKIGDSYIEVACGESKLKIILVEYCGNVGVPSLWIKSIRKRLS